MRRALLLVFLVAPLAAACHTIVEDSPSRPSPLTLTGGGMPIVNMPGPQPVTAPVAPVTPVVVVPVPQPTPVATPAPKEPTPAPVATPTPAPEPEEEEEEEEPTGENRNPIARMACNVYFVECDGQVVPGSGGARSAPVGCRVHLDATAKDGNGEHTYRTEPRWHFSDPGMIDYSPRNPWNPAFTGKGRHRQQIYAEADGVRCNGFAVDIY
jgi:hypothetical protein